MRLGRDRGRTGRNWIRGKQTYGCGLVRGYHSQAWRNMEELVRNKADSNIKNFSEDIFKARERLIGGNDR